MEEFSFEIDGVIYTFYYLDINPELSFVKLSYNNLGELLFATLFYPRLSYQRWRMNCVHFSITSQFNHLVLFIP